MQSNNPQERDDNVFVDEPIFASVGRHGLTDEEKKMYDDLRAVAQKHDLHIITSTQSTKTDAQ
jgi:DNA replication initiation complex subunit (GINS family)